MKLFRVLIVIFVSGGPAAAETQMWVSVDSANRRTCPSTNCGAVGKLYLRESVQVAEIQDGWARISKYYDASCVAGQSQYVDSGRAECTAENGIANGLMAEWIRMDLLSGSRPADPGAGTTGSTKLVAQSDDFRKYSVQFAKAAEALIASGQCTAAEIEEMGGFVKSTNKGVGVYFTYCNAGATRIYLDVATGRTFR